MGEPPNQNDDEDFFFDALDDFPFYDADQSDQSTSTSTRSDPSPGVSCPARNLRRRSIHRRGFKDSSSDVSSGSSLIDGSKTRYRDKRLKLCRDKKENENMEGTESSRPRLVRDDSSRMDSVGLVGTVGEEGKEEGSTVTTAKEDHRVGDSIDSAGELEGDSTNLLVLIAGLLIKAIGFQFNLFVYLVTFPLWGVYYSYMLVVDPFGAVRRGKEVLMQKVASVWNLIGGIFGSFINDWLKDHETMWKLFLQFGWGLFWSCYVCIILFGLLVFSVMITGFLMRYLVEEPVQLREDLNFDFTKNSPVAFVPVISCGGVGCDVNCKENIGDVKNTRSRVIAPNHKLQVTVSLTLPESEYNRNLGIFQIRADFLSADGKILASKRHPCMLKFKSEPIRLLLTFLKIAPLVAGYLSESQTLKLKIRGFTEGYVPTSCLKVIIEQRAEYGPGAGIPEIYDTSVVLESELPLFKRIIWCWKRTMFVWLSMSIFMMELLFSLVCCRHVIIPRARPREGSAIDNSNANHLPAQS